MRFCIANNLIGCDHSGKAKGSRMAFMSSRKASKVCIWGEVRVFQEMTLEAEAESIERCRPRRGSSATATRNWTKRALLQFQVLLWWNQSVRRNKCRG